MLSRGWFVAVPDFEGPYTGPSAQPSKPATPRSTAPVPCPLSLFRNSEFLLLPAGADKFRYALWGYSGGSLARLREGRRVAGPVRARAIEGLRGLRGERHRVYVHADCGHGRAHGALQAVWRFYSVRAQHGEQSYF
ncbi:uncharacterized protein F4812DRAFT_441058 [Daldinia caldariorum]|uniref:uncharacterized protein n=1 Tax=Daldinia caldariorum TaxID=326644 RepID=UPI002007B42F|nr:uncharacterized protein F4812DRAFT_441058 [Daldinia caldariorum]KAI1464946.1 hypothetical protein F4812DRAFT_441058 [Daldinia caldariorum]